MVLLNSKAEEKAKKAIELPAFRGIDLNHIKDKVTIILGQIGKNGIFGEYTRHDISHIDKVLLSLDDIIPESTANIMTDGEWLMLVLSVYFHDLGMLVTNDEYENRENSGFTKYKDAVIKNADADYRNKVECMSDPEKFLYQEFVRSKHAERIKNWISGRNISQLGYCSTVANEVSALLAPLDEKIKKDLGILCESHHLDDLDNFTKYEVDHKYGSSVGEKVNLHYCAIILRVADLLHITSDRTPSTEYRLINPVDPISQEEWYKQMAVKAVKPKKMRDSDGNIDDSIESDTFEITAYFREANKANGFFGLISYISYARNQLKQCYDWNQKAMKQEGSKYRFPWLKIDDSKIETEGFEPKLFEFNLDQGKILQLLVGHTLYNDSTVVLRELVQNSIDAIRLQHHIDSKKNLSNAIGNIKILWDEEKSILTFSDNGTGMTQNIIEQHLLKVGSSRYQSDDFKKDYPNFSPISRFGIGILTCFLVADNIDIITCHPDEDFAKKLTIRNVNGKYLLQHLEKESLDTHIREHGTAISLEIRSGVKMGDLEKNIKKWILFPPCNIDLIINQAMPKRIGYDSPKESLEVYLNEIGYEADNKTIKVSQYSLNGITIAYALKYSEHFNEWSFITSSGNLRNTTVSPIGTCIEGVRVEFNSPGFLSKHLIAVANASGAYAPKTNVARSDIEATDGRELFLQNIYKLYFDHVKTEIDNMQKNTNFSLTWAVSEAPHLLGPIIKNAGSSNEPIRAANTDVLFSQLEKEELLLVEQSLDMKRKAISIGQLNEIADIWTSDCDYFRSAESLVKEIKTSPSLLFLIKTLYEGNDKIKHINTLLCGFSRLDIIQKRALKSRFVSQLKVFPVERRVDVCWSMTDNGDWLDIVGERVTAYSQSVYMKNYFIQNKDFPVDGIKDEHFVECFDMTFLLSGSPIHAFAISCIQSLDYTHNDDDFAVMSHVLSLISNFINSRIAARFDMEKWVISVIDNSFDRGYSKVSGEIFAKKINKDDFVKAIVETNWRAFSPAAWTRSKKGEEYM